MHDAQESERLLSLRGKATPSSALALPEAEVKGIAAGLHAAVRLPETDTEREIVDEARRRRIALTTMGDSRIQAGHHPPTLMLGYAQSPEPPSGPE